MAAVWATSCGVSLPAPPSGCDEVTTALLPESSSIESLLGNSVCATWRDCPRGTTCAASGDGTSPSGSCEIGTRNTDVRNLLTVNFSVQEMEIQLEDGKDGDASVVRWIAPTDAVWVRCAVFGCPPEWDRTTATTGPSDILNLSRCVLFSSTVDARSSFSLAAAAHDAGPDVSWSRTSRPDCADPRIASRLETAFDLMASCWAFDDTDVIAASPIRRLSPSMLGAQTVGPISSCEGVFTERAVPCLYGAPDEERFGTCHDQRCRARCLRGVDCGEGEYCAAVIGHLGFGLCIPAQ